MITKTDLNQIRGVVSEEVDVIIESKLKPVKEDLSQIGNVIDEKLEPIKKDLTILKKDVTDLKSDVTILKKDVKYLKKKINRVDRTVSLTVKNYDEGDIKLERRVRKIEDHIGLTS